LFGIVVAVAVQSVFRLKMHQNNVFSFLKIILISAHQNDLKTQKKIIFSKKNSKFKGIRFAPHFQTCS
jgi:hypothetical protein